MGGPSWLAGMFAAVMILTAACSAGRLAVSRLRRRPTEFDADALHAVMGTAMAGMLVPRLNPLPDGVWAAVFGIAAAWFGWHALRTRGRGAAAGSRCRFPVPHLIECVAMLYMLLAVHGMAMPGMGAFAGSAGDFPLLALVLALFMVGYLVWTTDRLAAIARAGAAASGGTRNTDPQASVAVQAAVPALAPKLAVCSKIAMCVTMGYMLILML
jgi:Domain of unknown function (DUF5134)